MAKKWLGIKVCNFYPLIVYIHFSATKPINFFKAESRLNLRKPSIYPTPIEDDVSSLENCNSTSFFCINTLGDSFGSTKDLKPVRRDSLELESEADKSFKRKSKRKHFFRANSVDDSMFK